MTEDRIVFASEVAQKIGVTVPTLWRLRKTGSFPDSFQLGSTRRRGWRLRTVERWMKEQEARSPAEAAAARERSRAQRRAEDAARES